LVNRPSRDATSGSAIAACKVAVTFVAQPLAVGSASSASSKRGAGHVVDQSALLGGQRADGLAVHRGVGVFQPLTEPGERVLVFWSRSASRSRPMPPSWFARAEICLAVSTSPRCLAAAASLVRRAVNSSGLTSYSFVEFVAMAPMIRYRCQRGARVSGATIASTAAHARDCTLVAHKNAEMPSEQACTRQACAP